MMDYGNFLQEMIEMIEAEIEIFEHVYQTGTTEEKTWYLLEQAPSLLDEDDITVASMFWMTFDGVEYVDEIVDATPLDDILEARDSYKQFLLAEEHMEIEDIYEEFLRNREDELN